MKKYGRRSHFILKSIIKGFWPVIVFILGGGYFFRDAISASIDSTTDPEIVYVIIISIFMAVIMAGYALYVYIKEESILQKLIKNTGTNGLIILDDKKSNIDSSLWIPVYHMLSLDLSWLEIKSVIDIEVEKARESFHSLMQLPMYIAGALVGMGLVGTFVGLLSTLNDLASVFALMANIGGGGDPLQMFSQMILKLQGPIKGMGTAFVASLYGLVGSLVVGLVVLSVKGIGDRVALDIEQFIEEILTTKTSRAIDRVAENQIEQSSAKLNHAILKMEESILLLSRSLISLSEKFNHHENGILRLSNELSRINEISSISAKKAALRTFFIFLCSLGAIILLAVGINKMTSMYFMSNASNSLDHSLPSGANSKVNQQEGGVEKSAPIDLNGDKEELTPLYRTVMEGESLGSIAKECRITLREILVLNPQNQNNPNLLKSGSKVVVPNSKCDHSG